MTTFLAALFNPKGRVGRRTFVWRTLAYFATAIALMALAIVLHYQALSADRPELPFPYGSALYAAAHLVFLWLNIANASQRLRDAGASHGGLMVLVLMTVPLNILAVAGWMMVAPSDEADLVRFMALGLDVLPGPFWALYLIWLATRASDERCARS